MIRHIALLQLADTTTDEERALIITKLQGLPAIVPEIISYSVGLNAGTADGNSSVAVVGDFEDMASYEAYATNQDHLDVIGTYIKPHATGRAGIQYDLG